MYRRKNFLSFSLFFLFFNFVIAIATSTVVLSLVYIRSLDIDSSSPGKDRSICTRAISIHDIGNSGTSTGITNSIRKNEITVDQTNILVESSSSKQLSSAKTRDNKKEGRNIMQKEQKTGSSLAEPQFYARTSNTSTKKQYDLIFQKPDQIYSSPMIKDTYHDAIDDLQINKDPITDIRNMSTKIYTNWNPTYEEEYIKHPIPNQELLIVEPRDVKIQKSFPLENEKITTSSINTIVPNAFQCLHPFDIENEFQNETIITSSSSSLIRPLKSSIEKMQHDFDDNNDTSTSTTNRSIYLPIEKQRSLSEIIRKRNSRYKVEDYKRSFQKFHTFDQQQSDYYRSLTTSKSDHTLSNNQTSISNTSPKETKRLIKTKSVDLPTEYNKRTYTSMEQFEPNNKNFEQKNSNKNNEINDKMTVAAKKNLFEVFSKDIPPSPHLTRSKSFKQENSSLVSNEIKSPLLAKTYNIEKQQQQSKPEDIILSETDDISVEHTTDVFGDDTSKLTFKEKMVLFNKTKNMGLTSSSSLKPNRSRLTQPITAEEVQAAENLSPEPSTSSSKQLTTKPLVNDKPLMHDNSLSLSINSSLEEIFFPIKSTFRTNVLQENCFDEEHVKHLSMHNIDDTTMLSPEEVENMIPVSKRLEQLKTYGENEWKKRVKSINDANEFTVEGKLRQAGKIPTLTDELKPLPKSTRKTPTLKYNAKKNNIDQEQRAKTVDIIRLKTG
ncbi:unnamed protein product [Rotaria sp. Silwood2]|nr:unnamed protein product [Rotaria sp. Silwood2]